MKLAYDEVKRANVSMGTLEAVALGQQFFAYLIRLRPEFVDDVLDAMNDQYTREGRG